MELKLQFQSQNPAQYPLIAQEQVSRKNYFLTASQSLVLSHSLSLKVTTRTIKSLIVALTPKLNLLLFRPRLLSMMAQDRLAQRLTHSIKVCKETTPTIGSGTRMPMARRHLVDHRNSRVDIQPGISMIPG